MKLEQKSMPKNALTPVTLARRVQVLCERHLKFDDDYVSAEEAEIVRTEIDRLLAEYVVSNKHDSR